MKTKRKKKKLDLNGIYRLLLYFFGRCNTLANTIKLKDNSDISSDISKLHPLSRSFNHSAVFLLFQSLGTESTTKITLPARISFKTDGETRSFTDLPSKSSEKLVLSNQLYNKF